MCDFVEHGGCLKLYKIFVRFHESNQHFDNFQTFQLFAQFFLVGKLTKNLQRHHDDRPIPHLQRFHHGLKKSMHFKHLLHRRLSNPSIQSLLVF